MGVNVMLEFCSFLFFCISQGTVATHLRCDGTNNKYLAANLLLSLTVKIDQHHVDRFSRLDSAINLQQDTMPLYF